MKQSLLSLLVAAGFVLSTSPVIMHAQKTDTSFTVQSAAAGIQKRYPRAKAVESIHPAGIRVTENLTYAAIGSRSLRLDIFRPKRPGRYPAVVMLFGGGWRSGNRTMNTPMAEQLAMNGIIAASIDYRLSTEALYPAAVHDVKAAVRWLRTHGKRYGIDTGRIAVLGCSAGGQLAALTGATNGDRRFEGTGGNAAVSSAVQAVVDIDGVLDFTTPDESGKDTIPGKPSAAAQWFGATFRENPEIWLDASPVTHIGPSTPPILFVNSSIPRFHYGRDSVIALLNKLGTRTVVHTIPDTPHPFWLFHPWFAQTCGDVIRFLVDEFSRSKNERTR
jgi:acetyl esterase/lipase